jgi:hypothetical protein
LGGSDERPAQPLNELNGRNSKSTVAPRGAVAQLEVVRRRSTYSMNPPQQTNPPDRRRTPKPSRTAIAIQVTIISLMALLSRSWTLQAFVPEPYFLRGPVRLQEISDERTPPEFRGLAPLYAIILIEWVVLAVIAVAAIWFASRQLTLAYLLVVVGMAFLTLLRLSTALGGIR